MLTEKGEAVLAYWEGAREKESGFGQKNEEGLPWPCCLDCRSWLLWWLFIFVTRMVYKSIPVDNAGDRNRHHSRDPVHAVLSFTRMHFKWEMNEQLYQELKQNARRKMQRNQTNLNLK